MSESERGTMSDNKTLPGLARETLGIHESLTDEQAIALIHLWLSDKLPVKPLPEFHEGFSQDICWDIRFKNDSWRDMPFTLPLP